MSEEILRVEFIWSGAFLWIGILGKLNLYFYNLPFQICTMHPILTNCSMRLDATLAIYLAIMIEYLNNYLLKHLNSRLNGSLGYDLSLWNVWDICTMTKWSPSVCFRGWVQRHLFSLISRMASCSVYDIILTLNIYYLVWSVSMHLRPFSSRKIVLFNDDY